MNNRRYVAAAKRDEHGSWAVIDRTSNSAVAHFPTRRLAQEAAAARNRKCSVPAETGVSNPLDAKWVTFCKRTEDPKLAYIEWLLEGEGIDTRRNGHSFHAPILEVREPDVDKAWALLGPIDELEDDDPQFADAVQLRDEARADSAPPKYPDGP